MARQKQNKMRRVGLSFASCLDNLKIERIKTGVDKKMISDTRLTDGMVSEPEFKVIMNRLANKKRREDLL